jgi:hypothetical protein
MLLGGFMEHKVQPKESPAGQPADVGLVRSFVIKRVNPDNVRTAPVNDFVITHVKDGFFLTFSCLEPLPILDPADYEHIDSVEAIARAKMFITPEFAESMLSTLSKNLEAYKKEIEAIEKLG